MLGITGDIQIGRIMRRPRSELALRGRDCGPSPMLNHHGIGVDREGGKGETVLLLHGFGGSKDDWTAFAKYLKGYHLVIPDIPGFGESSQVPTLSYDIDSQVGRIEQFVEVLKLDTFHMAGNSLGGADAVTYGAKHPEKMLTIALIDTAGALSKNKSELTLQLEKGNNPFQTNSIEDYDRLVDMIFVTRPTLPASFWNILAADFISHTEFNMKIWNDMQVDKFSLFSVGPALSMIQMPVLIIWGGSRQNNGYRRGCFFRRKIEKPQNRYS